MSTAIIAHYSMTEGFVDKVEDLINERAAHGMLQERLEKIEQEKSSIAQIDNAEQLIKLMRSDYDIVNRTAICRKALEMQEAVMPLLLRRFQTSLQDTFIECGIHILACADMHYLEQLKAMYQDIRNPYAQSMACLLFGMQEFQDMIPLLLKEYQRMQRDYPKENYDQGPLLALYILHGEAWWFMKLKFENQDFQTTTVNAACDLFAGQEKIQATFSVV